MPSSLRSSRTVLSSVQVAGGLVVFGVAGYVFVAVTGHELAPDEANLAINFYFLAYVVGPGVFGALEQLATRSTNRALSGGLPVSAELRRVGRAGASLAASVMALLMLLAPILGGRTLHGDWGLYCLILVTPAVNAAQHLVRGVLAGLRQFGRFGGVLAVEGSSRALFCLLLMSASADAAWIYAVGYLAATLVALAIGSFWLRAASHGGNLDSPVVVGPRQEVGRSLVALTLAMVSAQALPNIAPLAVASRSPADSAIALAFGQAAVVSRIPMLLFFPIMTVLLPYLTAAATEGEFALVRRTVRRTLAIVAGLGLGGATIFVLAGPWLLDRFLAAPVVLAVPIMVLLAAGAVVQIAVWAVHPALIALGRDGVLTAGWMVGSIVTLGFALLPADRADPVTAAAAGQVVGLTLALLVALLGLRSAPRSLARVESSHGA